MTDNLEVMTLPHEVSTEAKTRGQELDKTGLIWTILKIKCNFPSDYNPTLWLNFSSSSPEILLVLLFLS